MSKQIDWSKAPEGATHWEMEREDVNESWMKLEFGQWYYWGEAKGGFLWMDAGKEAGARLSGMIKRPEYPLCVGLPNAGAECEVTTDGGNNWRKTSILFSDDCMILLEDYCLLRSADPCVYFRPIRTPEQIAADERSKAIDEMVKALGMDDPGTAEYIRCGLIYDAGYRKP